jgi:WD40 repeat protein
MILLLTGVAAAGAVWLTDSVPAPAHQPALLLTLADPNHRGIKCVAGSPQGRRFVIGYLDGGLSVHADHGALLQDLPAAHFLTVASLSFSPDERHVASGSLDGTVKLWDMRTGRVYLTFRGGTGPVVSVTVSPDGRLVAGAAMNGTVAVWATTNGEPRWTRPNLGRFVAFSPDGKWLAAAGAGQTLRRFQVASGDEQPAFAGPGGLVVGAAFSADGKWLAVAGVEGSHSPLQVWDLETRKLAIPAIRVPLPVNGLAFSRDGQWLAAACGTSEQGGAVKVWDRASGEALCHLSQAKKAEGLAFSRDADLLVATTDDVRLYEMAGLLGRKAAQ